MRVGLHYPNAVPGPQDLNVASLMRAESVKLLDTHGTSHDEADLEALRSIGVQHFTVRLPDSLYYDSSGNSHIPSYVDYASEMLFLILLWHARGVREFQIDNEPNLLHTSSGFGPYDYAWFMKRAVNTLQDSLRSSGVRDVSLVSPPLSFAPSLWAHTPYNHTAWTLDEWIGGYNFYSASSPYDVDRRPLIDFFDKLGANCYFQHPRQVRDPSFGASWYTVHERLGRKPVSVLEVASSLHELKGPDGGPLYTYEQAEKRRMVQYMDWSYWSGGSGLVDSCYWWIAPSCTIEWAGFAISEELARVLGVAGDGRNLGGGRGVV